MVPDWEWSKARFVDFVKGTTERIKIDGKCECDGSTGWNAGYGKFNLSHCRYHLPSDHKCYWCDLIGKGLLEDGLHILLRGLSRLEGHLMLSYYDLYRKLLPGGCLCQVKKLLKEASGAVKQGGRYITPHWKWLTHWDLCFGYVGYKPPGSMHKEVSEWLLEQRDIGSVLPGQEYNDRIYEHTLRYLSEEWKVPEEVPDLDQWLKDAAWIRGKAGSGEILTVEVGGKRTRTRRYKGIDAALKDDKLIKAEMLGVQTETMEVMQKSEGGKVRPVVKTGNELYRKMDYLSELVELGLYGSRTSTLFAGRSGNEQIDEEWEKVMHDKSLLKVPLDQASFDQHQSKGSIRAVIDAIGDYCLSVLPKDHDMVRVWVAMYKTLFESCPPQVIYDNQKSPWENGIPSGWRWTALLDTILNITSFRVVLDLVRERWGRAVPTPHVCAQGDDILFTTVNVEDVERIVAVYQHMGYKVHPQKTYISRDRGEFLRRSYEPGKITGYVTRTQLAIRFRNPVIPVPISAPERFASRVSLWLLFRQRGCLGGPAAEMLLEDAEQMGVPKDVAADFTLTPSSVGGIGLVSQDINAESMVPELRKHARGRWLVPRVRKERKEVKISLGAWHYRLRAAGVALDPIHRKEFGEILAATWGIREARLKGKVDVVWEEIDKVKPSPPVSGEMLPHPNELWDLEGVPILAREIVKKQALDNRCWKEWIKPERLTDVERLERRMSRSVFRLYLSGNWSPPIPPSEQQHARYGVSVKRWATDWVLRFFGNANMSLQRLTKRLLWLEGQITSKLAEFGAGRVLAV